MNELLLLPLKILLIGLDLLVCIEEDNYVPFLAQAVLQLSPFPV